jgi:hypothetical protein
MSYLKNLTSSFVHASPTILKNQFGSIANIAKDLERNKRTDIVKNFTQTSRFIQGQVSGSFSDIIKRMKKGVTTGKFYEENEEDAALEKAMGLSEDDFGFDE